MSKPRGATGPAITEEKEGQTEGMAPEEETTPAPKPGDGEEGTRAPEAKKEGPPPPPQPTAEEPGTTESGKAKSLE
ncbi:hypothetical protein NDU88_007337 [Pleurodeles waltl]|uniref:Uncharacterized protein n=1 Tax=Pleurodeles waltl TaxID=8319 RepID=A0AAV7URM1_PLEWA|nr:hypothetical protein NDU88_007337 [Pleurodeles waltl]